MPMTKYAVAYAMKQHEGQTRKFSELPYFTHCVEVYSIVKKYKESHAIDEICAAAILHDTVEDTNTTVEDLEREFSPMVASIVDELTNDNTVCSLMGKQKYINFKLESISSYALVIKLADILANVTDNPTEKMIDRVRAHYDYLSAGARRQGLSQTHRHLLDAINVALVELYGK
jgi:(p)ppGpp synthase/HD superfamily hydrolase